jgi:hypothetical protein
VLAEKPLAKDICEGVEAVHTAVRIDDMVELAIHAALLAAFEALTFMGTVASAVPAAGQMHDR